ncbi:MAG: DUF4232 domain-containing protein, partial [Cryobacterium sp.]|nr:DUF4232 domain-containing protein [Cryobacterium sp.]
DSGAGNFFWDLQLTNDSSVECTVEGYPAVSLVSANSGTAIGAVSSEEPGRFFPVAGWTDPRRVATPHQIDGCADTSTAIVRTGPLAPGRVVF